MAHTAAHLNADSTADPLRGGKHCRPFKRWGALQAIQSGEKVKFYARLYGLCLSSVSPQGPPLSWSPSSDYEAV